MKYYMMSFWMRIISFLFVFFFSVGFLIVCFQSFFGSTGLKIEDYIILIGRLPIIVFCLFQSMKRIELLSECVKLKRICLSDIVIGLNNIDTYMSVGPLGLKGYYFRINKIDGDVIRFYVSSWRCGKAIEKYMIGNGIKYMSKKHEKIDM